MGPTTNKKTEDENMIQRECMWVEFDEAGNTKKCMFSNYYEEIQKAHPVSVRFKQFEQDKIFHDIYCTHCLEGMKIEAMNEFRYVLCSVSGGGSSGEFISVEKIIKKLMEK